jgi:hypothetical protein
MIVQLRWKEPPVNGNREIVRQPAAVFFWKRGPPDFVDLLKPETLGLDGNARYNGHSQRSIEFIQDTQDDEGNAAVQRDTFFLAQLLFADRNLRGGRAY